MLLSVGAGVSCANAGNDSIRAMQKIDCFIQVCSLACHENGGEFAWKYISEAHPSVRLSRSSSKPMPAMTESAAGAPNAAIAESQDHKLLVGVALISFTALLLELALTRLFSVILFYHFAFLAISIALLGLGAGGVFAHAGRKIMAPIELGKMASGLCMLNALVIPTVLEIVLHLPVSLDLSGVNFVRLSAIYIWSAGPFFITGLELSLIFARRSSQISRLYGADLFGAAVACLGIVPLLNRVGGPNTILFAAALAGMAAAVWASTTAYRKYAVGLSGALLVLMAANYSGRLIDVVYAKGSLRDKSLVEFARWNAISRVEVD
jgi:hypothetical protein